MAFTPVCALERPGLPCAAGLSLVLRDAAAQRVHEIDHATGCGKCRIALLDGADLFGLEVREQRLLVAVTKGVRVEVSDLALQDLRGEREHVGRERQLR